MPHFVRTAQPGENRDRKRKQARTERLEELEKLRRWLRKMATVQKLSIWTEPHSKEGPSEDGISLIVMARPAATT
jgi:hypothetical protein